MLGVYQTQQNALLRVLIAKTFEALNIVEDFKKKLQRDGHENRFEKLSEFENELKALKEDANWSLAKSIRDHSTSHYFPTVVAANLSSMQKYPDFHAYLHKNTSNFYHPFGEEAVFLARIGRHFKELGRDSWTLEDLRSLIDWTLDVSRLTMKVFQRYFLWLHKSQFPEWRLAAVKPYLEPQLHARANETNLPVFIATEHLRKK